MNELVIRQASDLFQKHKNVKIIAVTDERTNNAAIENIAYYSDVIKQIETVLEPVRKELYQPYQDLLNLKSSFMKPLETYVKEQKKEVGAYQNSLKKELNEKHDLQITAMKSKTEFVTSSIKEKPQAVITDLLAFIQALIDTGNIVFLTAIFDKYNESKLNQFCLLAGLDGKERNFPGLKINMTADVRVKKR